MKSAISSATGPATATSNPTCSTPQNRAALGKVAVPARQFQDFAFCRGCEALPSAVPAGQSLCMEFSKCSCQASREVLLGKIEHALSAKYTNLTPLGHPRCHAKPGYAHASKGEFPQTLLPKPQTPKPQTP